MFERELDLDRKTTLAIMSQPMGTGALFTALFAMYQLLIVWRPALGTVQRLSNALATGVPVIARWCPNYEQATPCQTITYKCTHTTYRYTVFSSIVCAQLYLALCPASAPSTPSCIA